MFRYIFSAETFAPSSEIFIYFLDEQGVVMVGNEEAKLLNMEGNRRFDEGIVAGPFMLFGHVDKIAHVLRHNFAVELLGVSGKFLRFSGGCVEPCAALVRKSGSFTSAPFSGKFGAVFAELAKRLCG